MPADRVHGRREILRGCCSHALAIALWGFADSCGAEGNEALSIEHKLEIAPPGRAPQVLDLDEAMKLLPVPSASVTLIDGGRIAWSKTFGANSMSSPVYQAASMSKFVAAVGAMKLVEDGILSLDAPVDAKLKTWKSARPPLTDGRPVTLRWLLSMRAGINVPGFAGYAPGSDVPSLLQILSGTPPANSPPVEVVAPPGASYAYSGGSYEVVEALIADATGRSFADVARDRVLRPLGMSSSAFGAMPPSALSARIAKGHTSDGKELPGGWRLMPELAAAGLWSTSEDLARLLISISAGYHGRPEAILTKTTIDQMMAPQGGGPYGLGAAVSGSGDDAVLMKRGQNVGYQGYLLLCPTRGSGIVVMTGSDNGSTLANALIRRAEEVYRWPPIGPLQD